MNAKSANVQQCQQPIMVTPRDLSRMKPTPLIIDVQNSRYPTNKLPQARSLTANAIVEKIPRQQPILLACLSGYQSFRIAQFLMQKGYQQVYVLQGGVLAWQRTGFTVSRKQ